MSAKVVTTEARDLAAALSELLGDGCKLELGVPLAGRTTLGVGGPAEILARPRSAAATATLTALLDRERVPWTVLGSGSNVVIADSGIDGVVIQLGEGLDAVEVGGLLDDSRFDAGARRVRVGGAVRNAHTVKAVHTAGLVGPEFLALIPGAFGGAVAMNAGTRWGDLSSVLVSAECALPDGSVVELEAEALGLAYRHCELPTGAVVTAGTLAAWPGDVAAARRAITEEKAYRGRTQPFKERCAGSFFANPDGDSAGRLIDAAGLKGMRHGGAQVSPVHANFIVNTGEATATEVLELMAAVRGAVRARFGVVLRPEVKLLGFGPGSTADIVDNARPASIETRAETEA